MIEQDINFYKIQNSVSSRSTTLFIYVTPQVSGLKTRGKMVIDTKTRRDSK